MGECRQSTYYPRAFARVLHIIEKLCNHLIRSFMVRLRILYSRFKDRHICFEVIKTILTSSMNRPPFFLLSKPFSKRCGSDTRYRHKNQFTPVITLLESFSFSLSRSLIMGCGGSSHLEKEVKLTTTSIGFKLSTNRNGGEASWFWLVPP